MKRTTKVTSQSTKPAVERRSRGRTRDDATFPVAPSRVEMPDDYGTTLADIKQRVLTQRLRVVISANAAMVELYWDIGRTILDRQRHAGWGAKVIDRLSADLREAYPEMQGFSPRNLKYMRAFAAAWPDASIVQQAVARLPWRQNIILLERLEDPQNRIWYVQRVLDQGWSSSVLNVQIDNRAHERSGKAISNFTKTLPPADSDMAEQAFKDPLRRRRAQDGPIRRRIRRSAQPLPLGDRRSAPSPDDKPTIGLLLCRSNNKLVVEYALRDLDKPIGVAHWATRLVDALPKDLESSLPTIAQIEAELGPDEDG